MKKLINILLIAILILNGQSTVVNAQAGTAIPYQGVARNSAGNIVANQSISLRISILQGGASTGTLVYRETHSVTTNSLGLFNIYITGGTTTGTFNPLNWQVLSSLGAFIKVELDINGGSVYVDMGTTQLMSVPFALYAGISGATPGSVNFRGTWDASSGAAPITGTPDTKGYYYVVTTAGNTNLNGITDWQPGDWAIYNGTVWGKVDNSQAPVEADNVDFTPSTTITSTNVQDAIDELQLSIDANEALKLNLSGGTMTGDLILHADPTSSLGAATKQYVDATQTTVTSKVNRAGDTMTGDLILHADPAIALGAATKQYVDAGDNAMQAQVNSKVNRAGDTMTGNLILNADPTAALGAVTKQYVDAGDNAMQAQVNSKVNRAGDTMTGNLILNADPTSALGAVTKQYVDAFQGAVTYADDWNASTNSPPLTSSTGTKGDYYVVTVAGSSSLGGITDWKVGDWAIYNGVVWQKVDNTQAPVVANDVAFISTTEITSTNVQDAIEEVQTNFGDVIDSYIHETDDGVALYTAPGTSDKRFGIGVTAPASRLGIKAEGTNESLISFHDPNEVSKWNINLNPSATANTGFNLDQVTAGGNVSRLFIDETDGKVGMGTITPAEKLHVQGANDGANVSVMLENLEAGSSTGWLMSAIDDNAIAARQNTFAIHEKIGSSLLERITVLPTNGAGIKNVGINESMPYATLHVTKQASDPTEPVNLAENTGILCLGQIDDNNLAMDSRQIQARTGSYVGGGSTLSFTTSPLNLQPLGGGITINGSSAAPSHQATITTDGMLGLGSITPAEKIDIDGAIKIGTTVTNNPGTIRWSGSDFEGYNGTDWKSFTLSNWSGTLTLTGAPAITYNVANPKVGIGVAQPAATLDLRDNGVTQTDMVSLQILGSCENNASAPCLRIGTKISSTGLWSTNPLSKDIGIYVSSISGQTAPESNIAAVLNGNVVIGDVTSSGMIGTNGKNVLGFQNGDIPTQAIGGAGVSNGGIQIYSASDALGTSVFNVMTGDGNVIKLFRSAALTPSNNALVSPTTYGSTESDVINNLRSRINELESKLQALGLLN